MPAVTVQTALELALQHHRAGRLAEAEALYRQILAVQPNHAGALHFRGVIAHQTGRHDLAVEWIRSAIALDPNNAAAHSNLGEAHRMRGCLDEAIAAYRRAIQLKPDYAEGHNHLGNALTSGGHLDEALAAYRRALEIKPGYAEAHNNLGFVLFEKARFEEAADAYQRALHLNPNLPEAHYNLGIALARLSRLDEAAGAFRRALALQPDYAEAHSNLGNVLKSQGQLDGAEAAQRRAIQLKPDFPQAHNNLGNVLMGEGHLDDAIAAYRRALALKPDYAEAHNNLGTALIETRRIDEGAAALQRALEIKPDYVDAKFNQAYVLLLRGDFEQGWPLYEARWDESRSAKRDFSQPMWDGGPVDGRRVLIHAEQGLGDSIQFIRYAKLAAARGAQIVVECPQTLVELFRGLKGVSEVVAADDPLPSFDLHVPMLSQPWVFQTRIESIPRKVPYLFAEETRCQWWRGQLGGNMRRLKVGLAWTGNPKNIRLRKRHLTLDQLLPLWRIEGVEFFSLQVDHGAEQIRQCPSAAGLIDDTEHIHDFADTAALMAELDLIISVDTAQAHLAGALGRPVWTLLPFVPDWRWGLEGEDTPWYPTMRLFRQPSAGDWDSVILRVAGELKEFGVSTPRNPASLRD